MARIKNFLKNLFTVKWLGRIAIMGWILYLVSYYCWVPTVSAPLAVEQQLAVKPVPSPAPSWPSRDECERYYALTLHEAPAGRCNK